METEETLPQLEIDDLETIAQLIEIPRVTDIQEDENYYRCTYNGEQYLFKKDTVSTVEVPASSTDGPKMALIMRHTLDAKFTQDQFANREFIEVMMLHEIREAEYMQADFEDAHQRAVHDEMLYVIKYLGKSRLKPYLEYARKYRMEALEKQQAAQEQEEEKKRLARQQAEQAREAELRFIQQQTKEQAERARQDAEKSARKAAIEKARIELFYKNRPSLAQFRARAAERLPKLSDPFKNAFLRKNGRPIHYLTEWYTPIIGRPEEMAQLIDEAKEHIRRRKDKRGRALTLADYLNGYRNKKKLTLRKHKRDGSLDDREDLQIALSSGWYFSSVESLDKPQRYYLSQEEREHLQDILYLFEITERKSKTKEGLTPEFLQHVVLKSNALIDDSWEKIFFFQNDEDTGPLIAANDEEESEYRAIITKIAEDFHSGKKD